MTKFKDFFQDYFGWWPQQQLLYVLFAYVILVGIYSWAVPPFEGPDEPQHFAYITWLAEGKGFPPQGEAAWQTPVEQEAGQSPLYYLLGSIPARLLGVAESPVEYRPNPHFVGPYPRIGPDNDNRAIHYPGDANPLVGGWLALYAARALTVAFGLLLIFAIYALTRQIFPSAPLLALAAAAIAAVIPQVLFISSVVSNDIPGAAFSAVTLWFLALLVLNSTTPSRAVAVGVVYGLAVLTKASAIMLAVPIAIGLTWLWLSPKRTILEIVRIGMFIVVGATLVAGWWLIRSLVLYGSPLGLETHDLTPWAISDPASLAKIHRRWYEVFRSFWIALGWGTIRPAELIYTVLAVFTSVSLVGLIKTGLGWLRKPRPINKRSVFFIFLLTIAVLSVGFSLELWMRRVIAPYGRLMFPALAAITVLLATGWYSLHRKLPFAMAVSVLVLSFLAPFLLLQPAYKVPDQLTAEAAAQISPKLGVRFGESLEEPVAELISARSLARSVKGAENVPVKMCWKPLAQTNRPYSVLVHMIGPENSLIANRRTYTGLGNYPTTIWQPGYVFCDLVQVHIWEDMPRTLVYKVEIALYDIHSEERLTIYDSRGNIIPALFVDDVRLVTLLPAEEYEPEPGDTGSVNLVESSFESRWIPGEENNLILRWGISEQITDDYQLFVHLRDPDTGQVVDQADGPPLGGWYPTSWWPKGEVIVDERTFPLDADVSTGSYDLIAGFYKLATGERYGDEFYLGTVEVGP